MRKTLAFLALTAFVAGATAPEWAIAAPSAADILSANKAASGGSAWAGKATLKADIRLFRPGHDRHVEFADRPETPRFVDSYPYRPDHRRQRLRRHNRPGRRTPPAPSTSRRAAMPRQLAVNDAYRRANTWWKPDHGGAEIKNDGEKTDGRHDL